VKVDGVPSVRQRDGGHAITNALPITSFTGTVLLYASHEVRLPSVPPGPQW
jgi:hypothetical protein